MDMKLAEFLDRSKLSDTVKPEARVVVHRAKTTPAGLLEIKRRGSLGPVRSRGMVCELEVSGTVLAEGRIVRKKDGHYFKVTKIVDKEARHG